MNIHEYQAKEIFRKYGVPTPRGGVAFSGPEARRVAEELGGNLWVVKAQIHAGGRGLGGGVKLAKSLDEVKKYANGLSSAYKSGKFINKHEKILLFVEMGQMI